MNKKKLILVVDDDAEIREALSKKLVIAGFDVIPAGNGEEGFSLALKRKPDLILLDIMMPVMDGLTLAKKLREDRFGKQVPIIFLTVLDGLSNISRAMEEGGYQYLIKTDWKLDDVVEKVRDSL